MFDPIFIPVFRSVSLRTLPVNAEFIAAILLNRQLKTVKTDKAGQDFICD